MLNFIPSWIAKSNHLDWISRADSKRTYHFVYSQCVTQNLQVGITRLLAYWIAAGTRRKAICERRRQQAIQIWQSVRLAIHNEVQFHYIYISAKTVVFSRWMMKLSHLSRRPYPAADLPSSGSSFRRLMPCSYHDMRYSWMVVGSWCRRLEDLDSLRWWRLITETIITASGVNLRPSDGALLILPLSSFTPPFSSWSSVINILVSCVCTLHACTSKPLWCRVMPSHVESCQVMPSQSAWPGINAGSCQVTWHYCRVMPSVMPRTPRDWH